MEQILLTGLRQCWAMPSLAPAGAARAADIQRKLRIPDQSKPVYRSKVIPPFVVKYQVGTNPDGSPIYTYVEQAAPFPDPNAPFSEQTDPRFGICPLLSSYAISRCFGGGGLF